MSGEKDRSTQLAEIETFISYAVPADQRRAAVTLVQKYSDDPQILNLFHEHYSSLPEALEEPVLSIHELASQQGIRALLLVAESEKFFYLLAPEQIVYAGCRADDLSADMVRFLGLGSRKKIDEAVRDHGQFKLYQGAQKVACCPVCGVAEGDHHFLGCVVEICPWCSGQLSSCNCRFEKLDLEEITSEEELEKFEEMLADEGRVPFTKEQSIAYPGTSAGADK